MSALAPDHLRIRDNPARFGLRIVSDRLHVEGVELAAIAREVGTPLYVYGASHSIDRYRSLASALADRPTLICYAVKANGSRALLRTLARQGAGADIVSIGELERALDAGVPPDKIVFSGVGKRSCELDAALAVGIRSINVESEDELEQLAARSRATGCRARISLRINPDVDPDTHPYLATGLRETKFGIAMDEGLALALRAHATPELELVGLACHIGSQIVESAPFLDSFARLRTLVDALHEQGIALQQLDLGGGLGIPYRGDDPVVEPERWGRALVAATRDLPCELVLEPGRYLVGNGGVLVTEVLVRKRGADRHFVIVDAAMNDLIRPALYDAYHAVVPLELPARDAPLTTLDLVGPVCECGDFLARDRAMPWPRHGELLALLGAGAYGMSMASTYNTRPLAAEVLVEGERWSLIRPRRSVAALLDDECYPPWLSEAAPRERTQALDALHRACERGLR